MRHVRLLGLVLIAVFALGAVAAASASATERGLLTLAGEKGPVEIKTPEGAFEAKFVVSGSKHTITCHGIKLLNAILDSPGEGHFNLGKDADAHFTGCKEGATACSSESAAGVKDEKEVILVLLDLHVVNLEDEKGNLQPGLAALLLGSDLKPLVLMICGVLRLHLTGAAFALIRPLNASGVVTLTEDVTHLDIHFTPTEKCDKTGEKVCQEIMEKEPFLADVGKGFEKATVETNEFLILVSPMVLVDD